MALLAFSKPLVTVYGGIPEHGAPGRGQLANFRLGNRTSSVFVMGISSKIEPARARKLEGMLENFGRERVGASATRIGPKNPPTRDSAPQRRRTARRSARPYRRRAGWRDPTPTSRAN